MSILETVEQAEIRLEDLLTMLREIRKALARPVPPVSLTSLDDPTAESLRRAGQAAADALLVPWWILIARRRTEPLVTQRMVAMTVIRHRTGASAREVGRLFGRDAKTVLYAERTIRDRVQVEFETGAILRGRSQVARMVARVARALAEDR